MVYPDEYIEYLAHFHGDQDFFECHEILEEYWKEVDPGNKESIWVSFILMAVSCYHHRRGNFTGARKTLEKAIIMFKHGNWIWSDYGLDEHILLARLEERLHNINNQLPFKPLVLPINDAFLEEQCVKWCLSHGMEWKSSLIPAEAIVHRHLTRDRSEVILERNAAIAERKERRKK
ncbi:DUF309 domain-containing protein [Niallia sp. BSM11]|uniref:DUF309 domain-containing protein n=1 Tax=Niallia sp. BSM11 TaxID=3391576 RepID=UPI003984D1A0|nr:DUF309 domain-containing protein [Bacillus sp. Au-Bac7]